MNAETEIEEEKPLDPATEKVRKKLIKFSAVFMGLNMLALMAVLAAIVYKIGGYGDEPVEAVATSASQARVPVEPGFEHILDLPDDTLVLSASEADGRVLLNLRFKDGSKELWLYDLGSGQISGKVKIQ